MTTSPLPPPPPPPGSPSWDLQPPPPPPRRKRWYRRWPAWIGIGVLALFVMALIAGLAGGGTKPTAQPPAVSAPQTSQPTQPTTPQAGSPQPKASGAPAVPASAKPTFGVPFVVTTDHYSEAPTSASYTVAAPTTRQIAPGSEWLAPKSGQYLVFDVQIAAQTDGVDYNPSFEWYVRAPDGTHVDPELFGAVKPDLGSGTLHLGEKVRGNVAFDTTLKHGTLVFNSDFLSGSTAEWSF